MTIKTKLNFFKKIAFGDNPMRFSMVRPFLKRFRKAYPYGIRKVFYIFLIHKKPAFKKAAYIVLFPLVYLLCPFFLTFRFEPRPFKLIIFFYLVNGFIVFFVHRKNAKRERDLRLRSDALEEQINVRNYQSAKELQSQAGIKEKIRRYSSLKKVIEDINASLTLDSIAERLNSIVFSLIGSGHGTSTLYIIDKLTHNLSLFKTKKEDKRIIIKAKQGDIFDHWVLRHASPLLIEDINKDFRFDLGKLKTEDLRPVSSLISSPLISGDKFLGILRMDHHQRNFYSQDDLRFLVTICDLGAVALENGMLYQDTQELAIHDGLTSLFTKGYFMEMLKLECKRSIRHDRYFSLLMLDIDYFKNYNDKFGHVAGDIVLKSLSQNIFNSLKDTDAVLSRFGGEEFCIILRGADEHEAFQTAELLRKTIEATKIILRRQETNVTVSIGCATFSKDISDEAELIMKADKAMYQAKKSGRNRVVTA
jgi:diguanylate cyclase (GGDEF)-like protein